MTDTGAATAALIGATGGAGTTRFAVELAVALARDGRSVAVLDAAFGTQGLSDHVPGRLEPDLTALVTEEAERPIEAGLVTLDLDLPGRVACCPVRAPFERLARAKAPDAAQRFEARIEEATADADHVLVDTPPVAANQAVAAATACERTALVAPATERGADAVERMRDRLADLDVDPDAVVSTRGHLAAADVGIPTADGDRSVPVCAAGDGPFPTAIARTAEVMLGCTLPAVTEVDGLVDRVGEYVSGG